jgi:hypothetical protein
MKNFYILENWGVVFGGAVDPYKAPEQLKHYLNGDVSGHPRHLDGTNVTTSSIVEVDSENRVIKTKSGSCYKLGKPSVAYEELFPNATERLFGKK